MDSLTKRLLLNSGMWNTGPLPPLLNSTTRLVYPDETLKKSEIDLYNARKALKQLEDGLEQLLDKKEIMKRAKTVKSAIDSLGPREGRYFQRRYVHNSDVFKRAVSSRRRADSGAATRAAEARSLASAERARKAEEDSDRERKRELAKEKAFEKIHAQRLAEERKKANDDAERAALQKKENERLEKLRLVREAAEKRRKVFLANSKAASAAAQRAAEALKRNHNQEEAVAEKERLAKIAKQKAEKQQREQKETNERIEQIKNDLKLAQELWRQEVLKKQLGTEVERAKQLAEEDKKQKAIDKQIASDLALAERLRDEEFKKARAAEDELKQKSDAAKEAEDKLNWYNKHGWQKDWIKVNVRGDGNCLFRSVCLAMGKKDEDCHLQLRKDAMDYMEANLDTPLLGGRSLPSNSTLRSVLADNGLDRLVVGSREVVASDVNEYIKWMRRPGTWGTDFEVEAIINILPLPRKLRVVVEYPGDVLSMVPDIDGSPDDLHIYHRSGSGHYQAYVHRTHLS